MLDIVNAAVSTNTINTRRPDGQGQSPQAHIRLEPQLRQPQTRVPELPAQTQQAIIGNANANNIALLNNREQAALNAIRQQAQAAQFAADNRSRRAATETEDTVEVLRNSATVNTQQRPTSPAAAQRLAQAATAALGGATRGAPQTEAPQVEQIQAEPVNPADVPILREALLPDFGKFVGLRASVPDVTDQTQPLPEQLIDVEA